jgi:hypothetical protein
VPVRLIAPVVSVNPLDAVRVFANDPVELNVAAPVTPKVPPTVKLPVMEPLLLTESELKVARPEVESVEREVLPVTLNVPVIAVLPPILALPVRLSTPATVAFPPKERLPDESREACSTPDAFLIVTSLVGEAGSEAGWMRSLSAVLPVNLICPEATRSETVVVPDTFRVLFKVVAPVTTKVLPNEVAPAAFKVEERVVAPVTPRVPPTVALLVTAAELRVAKPEVERVVRVVFPVTPTVPATVRFPPTDALLVIEAELSVANPEVLSVESEVAPVTPRVPPIVAFLLR